AARTILGTLRAIISESRAPSNRNAARDDLGIRSYAEQVFIAPPWPAIFAQDAERKQSLKEAEDTYQAMVEVYSDLQYKLVSLPLATIEERAQFVLSRIS
ncbi:MAG: ATPase, partial [Novosphingobium pentaromativorans]